MACCVYRSKNADFVHAMLADLPEHTEVRLHALDEVVPSLSTLTLSHGPGTRMPLLASLIDARAIPEEAWLVLFDDDATFARRGRTRFFDVAARAGFDIAQPSIEPGQPHSFSLTLTRIFSVARQTRYVEVGPVVAFSPRARNAVLPFPEWGVMGWGVDIEWAETCLRLGLSQGIVDAEPIRHHGSVGGGYDVAEEGLLVANALERAGFESFDEILDWRPPRWKTWSRNPPWDRLDRTPSER